ncbi:hypothetical protein AZH43_02990 [Acinetobacter pragensis]|uniref:Uncharacterized protein n=1 Tax=Acinetobacter pragensis TaxID=1806892 RepID=A0A151XZG2_9GAMM|nr:hypothetical protein AZH43_02990 [Acinetobacter pragensis]
MPAASIVLIFFIILSPDMESMSWLECLIIKLNLLLKTLSCSCVGKKLWSFMALFYVIALKAGFIIFIFNVQRSAESAQKALSPEFSGLNE